jgi:CheY-like chemotaxis protein
MARLLIVDDDADVTSSLVEVLGDLGHVVECARDAERALALARANPPDAVIVDVELPGPTGPELAAALLAEGGGLTRIPIVLISGSVGLADAVGRVGTPYHLAKPFRIGALLETVERALRERRGPAPSPRPDGSSG